MEIFGREFNLRFFLWYYCFNGLIVIDVLLITISIIFQIPAEVAHSIQFFDFIVCLILLSEYLLNLYMSSPKKDFVLDRYNILGLIASIPFDDILPMVIPGSGIIRYLRLLKLIRIFLLSSRLRFLKRMFEKSGFHMVLCAIFFTIILFTGLMYLFGPTYGAFDDFYFVIVTLTTVGYGDITPKTYNEKVLSIILILIGIFIFSTVTAVLSSFLTDRILEDDEQDIKDVIKQELDVKSDEIMGELQSVREENRQLKEEISELKELIKEK